MARKTVELSFLVDEVNQMLAMPNLSTDVREAVAGLLERALQKGDAYRGYRYTDGDDGALDLSRRRYYGGSHG